MTILLVGFDSAWTADKAGAIVGVLREDQGTYCDLGPPKLATFADAPARVRTWQEQYRPATTLILLDQPTIVVNAGGQRHVENIVASAVSLRYGGVQPANTKRVDMFGVDAPVWRFLAQFGGPADPCDAELFTASGATRVIETYPVLAAITLGWTLEDARGTGRLAKYNPDRRTFTQADWEHLCGKTADAVGAFGVTGVERWLRSIGTTQSPGKPDQDRVDACICLLVALHVAERRPCLMVGEMRTGYMVVPHDARLAEELAVRCRETNRDAAEWLRSFP